MEIYEINVGSYGDECNEPVVDLLNLLFTRNLGPTAKNNELEQKFDIGIDPRLLTRVTGMNALTEEYEIVVERAIEEGLEKGYKDGFDKGFDKGCKDGYERRTAELVAFYVDSISKMASEKGESPEKIMSQIPIPEELVPSIKEELVKKF